MILLTLLRDNPTMKRLEPLSGWRRELVEQWRFLPIKLVADCLKKNRHRRLPLNKDDLESAANEGLVMAGVYYRPESGNAFSTYATYAIRQKLRETINRIHPVSIKKDAITKAAHGSMANSAVIARRILNGRRLPFHVLGLCYCDTEMIEPDVCERVHQALRVLDPRRRMVIVLRFGFQGDCMRREDIGQRMGLTRQRVHQMESEGLKRLERELRALRDIVA